MNEYLVPSICGRAYLYGSNADASVSSRIVAALTMQIQPSLLEQAFNEAMVRFPQMAVGLAVQDERRVFVPVEAQVPVFEAFEAESMDFADERLRGYCFKVSYCHKSIFVDYHRALADEYGMMAFVKAVLLRYLELDGYPVRTDGSVKLLSSDYFEAEGDDPMVKMDDLPASRPVWYMDATAVSPAVTDSDIEEVAQVRIPVAKLKRDYVELPNIPVTYIAPFFSHCVHELVRGEMDSSEYVVASVQVNLRPYFPSSSLRPYHTPALLAYNRNLNDYPYGTVLMSQKKLLEAQLKSNTLAYSAQRKIAEIERAYSSSATLEELDLKFAELQEKTAARSTYNIARIGNVILPDSMQRLVTEFYPVIPSSGKTFSVTIETFKGELIVTVSGRKNVQKVSRRLVELLQENDIEAYIADSYAFRVLKTK